MHTKTSKAQTEQELKKIADSKLSDAQLLELIKKMELWPLQKQSVETSKQPFKTSEDKEESTSINSPKALFKFLNSPQGKALKSYLEKIAFMNKKMMDESLHLLIMRDLFKRRLQAHMTLTAKRKRARATENLNAAYQEAIDKTERERRKKLAQSSEKKHVVTMHEYNTFSEFDALEDLLASCKHTKTALQKQLAHENVIALSLHKELTDIDVIIKAIDEKHALYVSHLNALDVRLGQIDSNDKHTLEQLMQEVLQEKEMKYTHIVNLIAQSPKAMVEPHLQEQDAFNLQIEALQHALDVAEGKKAYLNEHGETVDSHTKAHFVLRREDKIVKQDDAYFLIKAHESLENLGPDAKTEAQTHFEQMRPTLMPKKRALAEEHHEEKGKCLHRKALLHKKIIHSEKNIKELNDQLNQVNAAEKSIEAKILKITAPQLYKDRVQFLKNSGQTVQREDLLNLLKPLPNAKEATEYLHNEFNKLARGEPIPAPTLNRILNALDGFINKIPEPVPTKRKEEEMNKAPAMTPFSTSPKPKMY